MKKLSTTKGLWVAMLSLLVTGIGLQVYCSRTLALCGEGSGEFQTCRRCKQIEARKDGICLQGQFIPMRSCYQINPGRTAGCKHEWRTSSIPHDAIPLDSEVFTSTFDAGLAAPYYRLLRRCRFLVLVSLAALTASLILGVVTVIMLFSRKKIQANI